MVSKRASVNFHALIKILSDASKLGCQAAVLHAGWGSDLRQPRLSGSLAESLANGAGDVQRSLIHFRWDGGRAVIPWAPIVQEMWPKINVGWESLLPSSVPADKEQC